VEGVETVAKLVIITEQMRQATVAVAVALSLTDQQQQLEEPAARVL